MATLFNIRVNPDWSAGGRPGSAWTPVGVTMKYEPGSGPWSVLETPAVWSCLPLTL